MLTPVPRGISSGTGFELKPPTRDEEEFRQAFLVYCIFYAEHLSVKTSVGKPITVHSSPEHE